MVRAKPSDDKFQALGYPKEPASYKIVMQSINHHYKDHYKLHKKLAYIENISNKRLNRIVALKKQLTLTTTERDQLKNQFNMVWSDKEKKLIKK